MLLEHQRKRQALLLKALLLGAGAYAVYRFSTSRRVSNWLTAWKNLISAGWHLSDAAACLTELSSNALTDLKTFVESDADEIPQSVRQVSKLFASREAGTVTRSLTSAIVEGVANAGVDANDAGSTSGVIDRLLEKVIEAFLSDRGRNLVSLAMSVAARNSVRTLCDCIELGGKRSRNGFISGKSGGLISSYMEEVLRVMATERGERLMCVTASAFANSVVGAYLEKLEGVNVVEGILAAMAKPGNREALQEIAGTSSREAMSSLVQAAARSYTAAASSRSPPSPTTVYVNNFPENAFQNEDLGVGVGAPVELSPENCSTPSSRNETDSNFAQKGTELSPIHCRSNALGETSSQSHVAPVVNALVEFSKVPEARELMSNIVGSAAREGVRGMVTSFPDLVGSFMGIFKFKGHLDTVALHRVYVAASVLATLLLYACSQSLLLTGFSH